MTLIYVMIHVYPTFSRFSDRFGKIGIVLVLMKIYFIMKQ